jgi:IclR family transcriptional regulator, acetate operon repressor
VESPRDRPSSPATLIVSVQRALRLLEAVARHPGGAVAKALAREAGLPLGTTYHLLRTLTFEGYLRRQADGAYVISEGISSLVEGCQDQAVVSRVRSALATLRDETKAAAYFALYEDGEIQVKEIVDSPRAPRVDEWVDFEDAAHATALGKMLLSSMEPGERTDYLSQHRLHALTPRTVTDRTRLTAELHRSAAEGVVLDREEYSVGTVCVATPVHAGSQLGALAVSLPTHRIDEVTGIGSTVRRIAKRMSLKLSLTS